MTTKYTADQIELGLKEGLENWTTVLIEENMPDTIDMMSEEYEDYTDQEWPVAMRDILDYLMELQGGEDNWKVEYTNTDGNQQFTITANFTIGEPIL